VFLAIYYGENCILALFSMIVAYETQKHVPKYNKLHKYHESAVINLTTILAVLLSTVCEAILVIFKLNDVQDGMLLVITLRDCFWMFPMIYLLFIPKVITYISKCLHMYMHTRSIECNVCTYINYYCNVFSISAALQSVSWIIFR